MLTITLPRNDKEVSFPNRTKDDLPVKIKGKAIWTDHTDPRQSAYYIQIHKYHYSIEYINENWYHISWGMGTYHTKQGHKITQHLNIGLGTKKTPYLTESDTACIHLKGSDDTEPTTTLKTDTKPPEEQDTPVITRQESQVINQLASIMSTTMIANVSTIPQGTIGLSQVTTAPPQGGGRSGPPGGGIPGIFMEFFGPPMPFSLIKLYDNPLGLAYLGYTIM
jgi:hypothetical protein